MLNLRKYVFPQIPTSVNFKGCKWRLNFADISIENEGFNCPPVEDKELPKTKQIKL